MKNSPDIRYLYDMREVLYDQEWLKTAPNLELYYMYRGLKYKDGLRYDITTIPFQMLGKEFTKTKGHSHPGEFTELYEILEGQAIFLMQKNEARSEARSGDASFDIQDVYAVKAKAGDKVFIPAHYAHITINPGPDDLKMANWVADNFESNYTFITEKQGACYFAIAQGTENKEQKTEIKWIKNNKYGNVPELRFEEPNQNIPQDLKKDLNKTLKT